jgi:hypothetical protein
VTFATEGAITWPATHHRCAGRGGAPFSRSAPTHLGILSVLVVSGNRAAALQEGCWWGANRATRRPAANPAPPDDRASGRRSQLVADGDELVGLRPDAIPTITPTATAWGSSAHLPTSPENTGSTVVHRPPSQFAAGRTRWTWATGRSSTRSPSGRRCRRVRRHGPGHTASHRREQSRIAMAPLAGIVQHAADRVVESGRNPSGGCVLPSPRSCYRLVGTSPKKRRVGVRHF